VLDAIKGYGTVHGSAIYIDVADFFRQVFCHGAFSARRKSVDGNGYLFHLFLLLCDLASKIRIFSV
jgi:hypothetical protein